uniref:Methyltransferase-like protein 13 isoform X1 n=1 Tax=Rhizophora mucronata TaxID=61149 RepID=A0A2P2KBI5_RHIMU
MTEGMSRTEQLTGKRDVVPSTALAYLDPRYWDERFSDEEHYEWCKDYSHFRHLFLYHIPLNSSVLELGCGNSQLSEEMHKDGITDITCIDWSAVVVEKMQKLLSAKGYKSLFLSFHIGFILFLLA